MVIVDITLILLSINFLLLGLLAFNVFTLWQLVEITNSRIDSRTELIYQLEDRIADLEDEERDTRSIFGIE